MSARLKNQSVIKNLSSLTIGKAFICILAAVFSFTGCTTAAPPPAPEASGGVVFQEGVPGGAVVKTVEISARVTAIDLSERNVTLLGPEGKKVTVKAGPEAVNFDQVKVGDLVKATLTEELLVYLDHKGTSGPDGAAGMVALAPKGAPPGGIAAKTTQITATVKKIDHDNRTATLLFEDGSQKTYPVRSDIDLSQRKVGEKVVFQVTEMIAIKVEKP